MTIQPCTCQLPPSLVCEVCVCLCVHTQTHNVCMRACVTALSGLLYSGHIGKVVFNRLSPPTLQVTVNSVMSDRSFKIPRCQTSTIFQTAGTTVCNSCYSLTDFERLEA